MCKVQKFKSIYSEKQKMKMDATTIFYNLLKSIKDSNLNYVMNNTPFSAAISIKSSFIKRLTVLKMT